MNRIPASLNRRDVLQLATMFGLTLTVPSLAAKASAPPLTPEELTLIGEVSELIIPNTDTGGALAAGTQTMCMSECTSIPAASGCSTVIAGGDGRGGRGLGTGGGVFLRDVMASATLGRRGTEPARDARGPMGSQFPQRDQRNGGRRLSGQVA